MFAPTSPDRLVHRDELGAVRECRLDLDVVDHLRNGRHHLVAGQDLRSEEHTSELQSQFHLVCRLLLEKKKQEKKPSGPTELTDSLQDIEWRDVQLRRRRHRASSLRLPLWRRVETASWCWTLRY